MAETNDKPTLIHLANSSSQTILWLLEELSVPYNIRKFDRPGGKGPDDLKKTHPLGKAPQLILPDGRVLTQANAIIVYLLRKYDTAHRYHDPETDDPVREEYLVSLAIADIGSKLGSKFILHGIALKSPFFIRPVFNAARKMVDQLVFEPDLKAIFELLEAELEGREWFVGERDAPSRADFLLHFFVDLAVQPKYVSLEGYPRVKGWFERCEAREAWKRSLEKGNGYDLDFPASW